MTMKEKNLNRLVRLYNNDIPFVGNSKQKSDSSMCKTFQKRVIKAKKIRKQRDEE